MNALHKTANVLALLNKGQSVADPALWKSRQVTTNTLAAAIVAAVNVAKTFGLDLGIDTETANAIALVALAAFNGVLTITTSKTVGIDQTKAI